jgi:hypothetical protein
VESFLQQVIDPTLGGPVTELALDLKERQLNTASGHLDWKHRFDKVVVPTVYSKVNWAKRRLHFKELLSALDVPSSVQSKITIGMAQAFTDLPVPGIVQTHILRVIVQGPWQNKRAF